MVPNSFISVVLQLSTLKYFISMISLCLALKICFKTIVQKVFILGLVSSLCMVEESVKSVTIFGLNLIMKDL